MLDDGLLISQAEESQDKVVGLRNGPHPAFDGEGIGELEIRGIAQFDLCGKIGEARSAVADHSSKEQTIRTDIPQS